MNKSVQPQIMLASASPRRKQLLEQLGWSVLVQAVNLDETPYEHESADDYCLRMANEKAIMAESTITTDLPLLTADTTVSLAGQILGKPEDEAAAFDMLKLLSNRVHQVFTAVSICYQGKIISQLNTNEVKFAKINESMIHAYIATGEPLDKAGSYGIQGLAAMWISEIKGSYSGIMGLPLFETTQLLYKLDIISPLDVLKTS